MSKHTPGPWESYMDRNGQAVICGENNEIAICLHHCVERLEVKMRHNARLIAAAPDLLAVLKDALGELEYLYKAPESEYARPSDEILAEVRAAIAKAEAAK